MTGGGEVVEFTFLAGLLGGILGELMVIAFRLRQIRDRLPRKKEES